MKRLGRCILTISLLAVMTLGQNDLTTFRAFSNSAFVWGENTAGGAVSSSVRDPLTGKLMRKLTYAGIEVSSQLGFERLRSGETGTLVIYTATIVNSTGTEVSVRHGAISHDGRAASPLVVAGTEESVRQRERHGRNVVELRKMQCFSNGFVSASDNFASGDAASQVFRVAPGASVTLSSMVKDPRSYPLRCSVAGCYPTGTMRYYVRVNSRDYVFIWPGESAIYCGR